MAATTHSATTVSQTAATPVWQLEPVSVASNRAWTPTVDGVDSDRRALSSECSVHVSSTDGVDSDACGEAADSACKSIQTGLNQAGDGDTVCVHKGLYGCESGVGYGGWAGSIRRSITLRGFDTVVDCNGAGGAFRVSGKDTSGNIRALEVVITGFHIYNAVGDASNDGYAGGVDAKYTKSISVLSSTFLNCAGQEAGAISVHEEYSEWYWSGPADNHVRTLQNLTIRNCHGGVSSRLGGAAGSISISYYNYNYGNNNNIHTLSALQISDSSGGTNSNGGGAAGSISISYSSYYGDSSGNTHTLSDLQISNSFGGTNTRFGGGAGSISISYYSYYGDAIGNTHTLSDLQINNSSGGRNIQGGGGAGSISISYVIKKGAGAIGNTHTLSDLQISNSSGGRNTAYGGAAGSISISFWTSLGGAIGNTHTLSALQISDSSGGTNSVRGGAAGSISISYYSEKGGNNNNTHTLSALQISDSSGGTTARNGGAAGSISICFNRWGEDSDYNGTNHGNSNNSVTMSNLQVANSSGGTNSEMGGAGGVAITYEDSLGFTTGSANNTHVISNCTIQNSTGGDPTQGAGAFLLQSLGITSGLNVTIQDSVFMSNQIFSSLPEQLSPQTGVAGAVRIYAKKGTSNRAQIINTRFHSNMLDEGCTSGMCLAGALAISVPATVDLCTFDSNICPRGSGGLYADHAVELRDCTFINNNATQVFYGTANVGEVSAVNTSMHFSGSRGGVVFSNLSTHDGLRLTCPPGTEIDNSTQRQYTCEACPSAKNDPVLLLLV
jgi:hypothetical protein